MMLNIVFCPAGLWNHSFAGKIEQGECPAEAARRELEEESGLVVQPDQLEKVGYFEYEFEDGRIMGKIMAMHIYRAVSWAGEAVETGEMRPSWCPVSQVQPAGLH